MSNVSREVLMGFVDEAASYLPEIIDGVKAQVTKHATEAITGALPGMLDAAMPELPAATGGAVPSTTGLPF